jgi:hypothetical protein
VTPLGPESGDLELVAVTRRLDWLVATGEMPVAALALAAKLAPTRFSRGWLAGYPRPAVVQVGALTP